VVSAPPWRFAWRDGPVWTAADGPRLVGIVNVTPDSFSDGGRHLAPAAAADHAARLVAEGADAIDIGAESTRPGHAALAWSDEWRRLEPALRRVRAAVDTPISVDTRHAEVARRALDFGAQAVNDVSGLADPAMAATLATTKAAVIVGHWRPRLGPWAPAEVFGTLGRARAALMARGVEPERIALDPGLGFGKDASDNWRLLAALSRLAAMGAAVMVGASRKRFVTAVAAGDDLNARDQATALVALWAALAGAAMLRVHAPAASVPAVRVAAALRAALAGVATEEAPT
jgi:dihydropteroate synthase